MECRNSNGLTLADLHHLAGKWDGYPTIEAVAPLCPVCGATLKPLTVYCNKKCHHTAYKRSYRAAAKRRAEDALPGYSFPPPSKDEEA